MNHRTPIRVVDGVVLAWCKQKDGTFRLMKPTKKSVVLYEPWGKPHTVHMENPKGD